MTNNPNDMRVSRELLALAVSLPSKESREANERGMIARGRAQAEIRAILAQPADQQGEPVAITELRHIFDSNKGADRTLVISKKLAAQLLADQPATARVVLRAEARECRECNHVGINDESPESACHSCDWSGEHQTEDKCPGCGAENCMAAACPKCGGRYVLIAEAKLNGVQS